MNCPAPWLPFDGKGLTSKPGNRSAQSLVAVIDQFDVEHCPRYTVRDTTGDGKLDTFCNVFAWDVSRALGAELPHWVDDHGKPALARAPGARELSANALVGWLHSHGAAYGWTLVPEATARIYALSGHPAFVTWKNPRGGSGHIAVVKPGPTMGEPQIAQAGANNFTAGTLSRGFGSASPLEWWIHD